MNQPDLHVVGEDDGEMHRVDAERHQRRRQNRQHQQQGRGDLEETTEHQQQPVDDQQELPGREMVADDEVDELVGNTRFGHPVTEGQRGRHDQHDGGGAADTVGDDAQGLRPMETAVENQRDQ